MAKRAFIAMLAYGVLGCLSANAQQLPVSNTCPYTSHPTSLACLIPDFTTNGQQGNLSFFNTTVAQVLGQLPLAAPVSGVVIGFNRKLAVPEDITENLGTILTERGNTVGKYKLFAGFTYQRFVFNSVDGTKLSNLPIVFSQPATSAANQIVGYAQNTLSANVSQYTGILAFGLTDRIDVSAILPFQRVSLAGGYTTALEAQVPNTGGTPTKAGTCPPSPAVNTGICTGTSSFVGRTVAGSATGIGDLILVVKGTAYNGERAKIAAGLETRFPTGDVFNLLGTGAYGVKPYAVFSYFWGRLTPHANIGYQWNGFSVLRLNQDGGNLRLPSILDYSAGADIGLVKRKLSVVADLLGQHFYNAPRILAAAPVTPGGLNCSVGICIPDTSTVAGPLQNAKLTSIGVNPSASYNVENMSVGLKWSPKGNLIIAANALLKLNDAGLRAKYVPLVGISYRFGR